MGQTASVLGLVLFQFIPDQLFAKLSAVDADLTGRTFLVTGSNTGLGLAAAIHLARLKPALLILGVRDLAKGAKAAEEIIAQTQFAGTLDVWELDMSKFDSVKSFAEKANNTLSRLDGAIINAGIASPAEWSVTTDGWERTLQVNGIATGLLSVLLLPLLQATTRLPPPHPDALQTPPHLTITGSGGQYLVQFREKNATNILRTLNDKSKWVQSDRYFVTKVFNLFLGREISALPQARGVVVNVVDPGLCRSEIDRDAKYSQLTAFLFRTLAWSTAKGALNLLYAVLSPTPPGAFISSCETRQPPAWWERNAAGGSEVQRKVWDEMVEVWRTVSPDVDAIVKR
ncbi:hypothetical protein FB451DRAFT_1263697 [Mycena latifolia]|nr:hypothetical protein FB451DRAFT_1263697 [Mycena latifolia]